MDKSFKYVIRQTCIYFILIIKENHVKNRFYSFIKRNYLGEKNRY